MSNLNVSDEAVVAQETLRSRITELHIDLLKAAKELMIVFDENQTGLGRHSGTIMGLLEDLSNDSSDDQAVKMLRKILTLNMQIIKDHQNGTMTVPKSR